MVSRCRKIISGKDRLKEISLPNLLSWVWLFSFIAVYVAFMWSCGTYMLDADMSSEMVLASILADENSILTTNWYYSTELRVLNTQLVFSPLFEIFTDWHVIRTVGSVLCVGILLISYYYFLRGINLQRYFAVTAVCMVIPWSELFFDYVTYGLYYIPHIAISFVTLGLLFRLLKEKVGNKRFKEICLYLISFLAGLGGLRQICILYIPLFLTAAIYCAAAMKNLKEKFCLGGELRNLATYSLMSCVASLAGYLVNNKVLSGIYNFSNWESIEFAEFSWDRVVDCVNGVLGTLGYRTGEVFSVTLVWNFVFLLIFILILAGVWSGMQDFWKGEMSEQAMIVVFFLIDLLFFILLYSFTSMKYEDRYNLPILVFALPVAAVGFDKLRIRRVRMLSGGLIAIMLSACVITQYQEYAETNNTNVIQDMADQLAAEGYTSGYSSFWYGNLVTELSNGVIDMRVWGNGSTDGSINAVYNWLQKIEHSETRPEGKCFILLGEDQWTEDSLYRYLDDENIVYSQYYVKVWGYSSYEEMVKDLASYTIDFSEDDGVYDGEDDEGIQYVDSNGGEFNGPEMTLYEGTYEIVVKGDGLEGVDVTLEAFDSAIECDIKIVDYSDTKVTCTLYLGIETDDCEICVTNHSDETAELSAVTITKSS